MQIARIVQAAALMLIVALAASCAATREYAGKLFPAKTQEKDSQAVALRFLELDKLQDDQSGWVSTDIIMGRDTGSGTAALDKLSNVFPADGLHQKDSVKALDTNDALPVYVNNTAVSSSSKETVKTTDKKIKSVKTGTGASVTKTIPVTQPVVAEKETEPAPEETPARSYTSGETREKKVREK